MQSRRRPGGTAAYNQRRPQTVASLRDNFITHRQKYSDLLGILAPIGDTERECNVTTLPPTHELLAG